MGGFIRNYVFIISNIGVIFMLILALYAYFNVEGLKVKKGKNMECTIMLSIIALVSCILM